MTAVKNVTSLVQKLKLSAAAPILFDLVNIMKPGTWFTEPVEDMTMINVCTQSGYRAGPDCKDTHEIPACINGLRSEVCPFHQIIHLDKNRKWQVTADCVSPAEIRNESWFILPPAMEYFYRQKHPEYKILPPYAPGCSADRAIPVIEFIYPSPGVKIFIPRDQTGMQTRIIPEVVHRNSSKKIFWHLDKKFVGITSFVHQIEILADAGDHVLTVVDEDGNSSSCGFSVIGRND